VISTDLLSEHPARPGTSGLHHLPWEPRSERDSYSFLSAPTDSSLPFGEERWSFLVSPASKLETIHLGNAQAAPFVHFSVLCINFFWPAPKMTVPHSAANNGFTVNVFL